VEKLGLVAVGEKDLLLLRKLFKIFFLGQLVGLPTLKSILTRQGISSNKHQINYTELCKRLSNKDIQLIFDTIFEQTILEKLEDLHKKHDCVWSRELVTAIVDGTVFRSWLSNLASLQDFGASYGVFYSGQFSKAVWGQKVICFGLAIDGVFYPLYMEMVQKNPDGGFVETDSEIASRLVEKWAAFLKKKASFKLKISFLHLSCDSEYNNLKFAETCAKSKLKYICVPKKNHVFRIGNETQKLSQHIETSFLTKEKAHLEKQKNLPKDQQKPFIWRTQAFYKAHNQDVTLLFFRLDGSKKVSVVYSFDRNIFAKTLRRHWFQRTQIEQFFRLLKHTLQIAQALVGNQKAFELKIYRFFWLAFQAQQVVRFFRKHCPEYKHIGFQVLQRQLANSPVFFDLLQDLVR
jgi:hypothetical protein